MSTMVFAMLYTIQNVRRARTKDWDNYHLDPPVGMVILTGLIDTIVLVVVFFVCRYG